MVSLLKADGYGHRVTVPVFSEILGGLLTFGLVIGGFLS